MSRQERERKSSKLFKYFCDCCLHIELFLIFNLQWFVNNNAAKDEKIDIAVLKYKADLQFAKQDYSDAKILYAKILEANVRPNSSNYRDNSEALIRCLINLDEGDEAFELSFEMVRRTNLESCSYILLVF